MDAFASIAMLIFVSAATPGPNNVVVLRKSVSGGIRSVLPSLAGIVLGGIAMLVLAQFGLATVLASNPRLHAAMGLAGAAYLVWMGVVLMARAGTTTPADTGESDARGAMAMFGFQFTNPKAWTLALTVVGASQAMAVPDAMTSAGLLLLFAVISSACLMAWALLGTYARRVLADATSLQRLDRAMGALLVASAAALLFPL